MIGLSINIRSINKSGESVELFANRSLSHTEGTGSPEFDAVAVVLSDKFIPHGNSNGQAGILLQEERGAGHKSEKKKL